MDIKIDIKTPAGRSLEAFPREFNKTSLEGDSCPSQETLMSIVYDAIGAWTLHPGDKITIEIL